MIPFEGEQPNGYHYCVQIVPTKLKQKTHNLAQKCTSQEAAPHEILKLFRRNYGKKLFSI